MMSCAYSLHGRFKYIEILVCNSKRMTHLGTPRHKWENNINPFQSNISANRILPSSYLFWAVKRLLDYL
jgi:hypothetical protein